LLLPVPAVFSMTFRRVRFAPSVLLLLGLPALLAAPAQAQRAADGPPAADPFGKRVVPARVLPGGRYQSHKYTRGALFITSTDGARISIQRWASGIVKVEYRSAGQQERRQDVEFSTDANWPTVDGDPAENYNRAMTLNNSVSVVLRKKPWERDEAAMNVTSFTDDTRRGVLRLRLGTEPNLEVLVQKIPLRVSILQGSDTLVAEAASAYRRVAAAPTPATMPAPGGTAVKFRLQPGEALYGTGSRALPLDRRGYRLDLYNQAHYGSQNGEPNLNITLPVVLSSRGYLLLFDHHTAGYLDLGKTNKNTLEYGGEGLSSLCYYVVTGKSQAEILDRYTALTGRQPLPPRWALGLIQSRFGYKTEQEMYNVAGRMRREGFPLDALVLDLFWFGGTKQQGDLDWYRPSFPDPAGMMARLKKDGVNTILISEPYVMRTSRNDSTVRTQGLIGTDKAGKPFTVGSFWAGPASIIDVFKPSARAWLWSYYKKLHDQGVAGWWSDLGEPENHPEAMQHAWGPTRQVHNAYGQEWAGIFTENYAREYPNERIFNLARSGWAGMQRNSVFPWSGDINRSWSGLQAQVPGMLGMGQAGVGYMHSDAGGFCVGPVDPELYTRWLQMASLCPVMRPHGEGVPPEPYWFPNPYKSAVRDAAHLRYELHPYLYTLAWENTTKGLPLARTMDYDKPYGGEEVVPGIGASVLGIGALEKTSPSLTANAKYPTPNTQLPNDQYLLGPNLLVAPILHPSQRRRNVELPAGSWIDFYTNQTYAGGRTAGIPAPLARTPLLVKAGAFVPMTPYQPSTARYRPDTLLVRYYPDPRVGESEFTLYEDDGHSAQALAKKEFETLTMRGFWGRNQTDVLLSSDGEYPGQPVFRLLKLLVQRVAAPPTAVFLDGQLAPAEGWTYNAERRELDIHFLMNAGTAVSIRGLKIDAQFRRDDAPDALTLEAPSDRTFGPGGTTLHYTRQQSIATNTQLTDTQLRISDSQGRVVFTAPLSDEPGAHSLRWNARTTQGQTLPLGVYTAEAGGQHQRLILTQ
jgi:oligosaccharide 4-alpha-D-glucosyltransferase